MAPVNGVHTNGHSNGHAEMNQNEAIYASALIKARPQGTSPYSIGEPHVQANRVLRILRSRKTDLERYEVLNHLRSSNAALFYKILIDNLTYCVPLVYTPVIGEACLKWHEIFSGTERALWLTMHDRGRFDEILAEFPQRDVEIAVMTDGSRILGLGDLGSNGMGIPIGKLSLYVACAGVDPSRTLPVHLDCGTNNEALLADAQYMGLRHHRISDDELLPIVQEFLDAFHRRWPKAIMQFEDFRTEAAFAVLEAQQEQRACFNDDIQGTAAVSLAGFINALRLSGTPDPKHRFVFFGAGSAAVGIGHLMCEYFVLKGIKEAQAKKMFYFVDSKGLVSHNRGDKLPQHKLYFARDEPDAPLLKSLIDVINFVKPTGLLGLSTIGGSFDQTVLERMAQLNNRPIIFPLSNPSSKAECSFEKAMKATNGTCLFGSGSPFPPVIWQGKTRVGGQANNMYIFPFVGLAAILASVKRITNKMMHASAEALANSLSPQEKADELLYPVLTRIREICVPMTRDLIRAAQAEGIDTNLKLREMSDASLEKYIAARMWAPEVANSHL